MNVILKQINDTGNISLAIDNTFSIVHTHRTRKRL